MNSNSLLLLLLTVILFVCLHTAAPSITPASTCRASCGRIPISYPFGIDDGCGSPYYRRLLSCSGAGLLELRTPSGRYPVRNINYSDPHLIVADPSMWICDDRDEFRPALPFSLDASTHLKLSPQNDYLFFNCSEDSVIVEPRPVFCDRYPDRCDSSCDSSSYLCRHLPGCGSVQMGSSCCSYYPRAMESLRMMLRYCSSYSSVYWRNIGSSPYDQVAEYGIRVDFDIPVTGNCLRCEDGSKYGARCGFDTQTESFLCLCNDRNSTSYCDGGGYSGHVKSGMIAGTVTAAGAVGIGAGVWLFKKVRARAPVTCGVQSNENRLF